MYGSQINSGEVQKNGTGSFSDVGSNVTSSPIVIRHGLPGLEKNKPGMNARNVGDKKEGDEPLSAPVTISGDGKTITKEHTEKLKDVTSVIIEDGVQEIGRGAFRFFGKLKEIRIPQTVTSIGASSFWGCDSLKEIEIPDGVTEIGFNTFSSCWKLSSIKLPNKLKKIGVEAFKGCRSLNKIDLPDSIEEIGEEAFTFCTGIEKLVLPKELKKVNKGLINGFENLKEIDLPENMTEIEDNTFSGCKSIEKVVLSRELKKIGKSVFNGCESLAEVVNFPKELQEMGPATFRDCRSLKNIDVPSGISRVDYDNFYNCKSLKKVDIPEGIKSIGMNAFWNCSGLESVSIPRSIESIESFAFADCRNLVNVYNFPKLGLCQRNAFLHCVKLNLPAGIDDNNIKHENIQDKDFIYKVRGKEKSLKKQDASDMPLFSAGGPKMEDIQQGYIGDCWLVASLAAIVKNNPKAIENIMKDNKDGTVDVTLQRNMNCGIFKKEVYTVQKSLFQTKPRLFRPAVSIMSNSKENIWVQMIEKAFSAYFGNDMFRYAKSFNYNSINGGGCNDKDAFEIILGKEANGVYKSRRPIWGRERKELFERVKNALDSKTPLYYSISKEEDIVKDVDGDRVVAEHAFSLIGAEEKDGKYYITLRNPWGCNYNKNGKEKDAIITVDFEEATNTEFYIGNLGEK